MSFNDNKQFWSEFIELYRDQKALWDVKSKLYCNKHARKEGYDILMEKCKELYPECDLKFVKNKIENLRASFSRELKKVQSSKKTGSDQEEIYEPSLWYYNLMIFITDQESVRKGISSIDKRPTTIEDEESVDDVEIPGVPDRIINNIEDAITEMNYETPSVSRGVSSCSSRPSAPSTPGSVNSTRKNRKKITDYEKKSEIFLDTANSALTNQNKFKAFGNNIAFQLEDMDRQQQVIAEKLISDLLFHGKLGNLTSSASILPEQPKQRAMLPHTQTSNPPYRPDVLQDQYTNYQNPYSFDSYGFQNLNDPNMFAVQQHLQQILPVHQQQLHEHYSKVGNSQDNPSVGGPRSSKYTTLTSPVSTTNEKETAQKEARKEISQYLVLNDNSTNV